MTRVLLGTPIHESKDYSIARWLGSISKFDYPFDLLMVDNSPNSNYVNQVHTYCRQYNLANYQLVHIESSSDSIIDERLSISREIIRQEVLQKSYDTWCSVECDIIAPPDALSKLVNLIEDNWMITHVYPTRGNPSTINAELGLALIKRQALQHSFINGYGHINPASPKSWYSNDVWFLRSIDWSQEGKRLTVSGLIKPIYHLDQ